MCLGCKQTVLCKGRGKWGLPLPRKHSLVTLVGRPIHGAPARHFRLRAFLLDACAPVMRWQSRVFVCPCGTLGCAVTHCDKPSAEEVDRLHVQFTREIVALFDVHKRLLPGWEGKQLHVV